MTVLVALIDDPEDGPFRALISQNRVGGRLTEGALNEEAPLCIGLGLGVFLLESLMVRQGVSGSLRNILRLMPLVGGFSLDYRAQLDEPGRHSEDRMCVPVRLFCSARARVHGSCGR